ncbi:MAG: hypothetical protein AB7I79_13380 [Rhizobiaceae bacterium]
MGRLIAAVVIVLLLLAIVMFLLSKVSDRFKGQGQTLAKIAALIIVAAAAYWVFGEGFVFDYFND